MDEDEETAAAISRRTITTDGGEVGEREKIGAGGEFRFLNAGYQNGFREFREWRAESSLWEFLIPLQLNCRMALLGDWDEVEEA